MSFVYALQSVSRAAGTPGSYSVYPSREMPGNYRVSVKVSPFLATNDLLELRLRAGGLTYQSANASASFQSVLTIVPGLSSLGGVLYVSEGFRGPIDVQWVDPSGTATDAALPEHVIYFEFVSK